MDPVNGLVVSAVAVVAEIAAALIADELVNANKALEKMELTIDNLNNVLEIEKNYELLKDLYLQADS